MHVPGTPPPPRAFLSHASEDKPFVENLARRLRADGVEAWFDRWEIRPGDKLVQRIFDEGIARCDIFVIVLSTVSVNKPWVREEMETGVVQRILGKTKLIPIRLDEVPVPVALRSTTWVDVGDRTSFELEYRSLLSGIYNTSEKPALGSRPHRLATTGQEPVGYSIEEANLLRFLATSERAGAWALDDVDLAEGLTDFDQPELRDLVEGLCSVGAVKASFHLGGFAAVRLTPRGWKDVAPQFGFDATEDAHAILVHLVAAGRDQLVPAARLIELLDGDAYRAEMGFDLLEKRGLAFSDRVAGGFHLQHLGTKAAGRRAVQRARHRVRS